MYKTRVTPQRAWQEMLAGNKRFVVGGQQHPHQDSLRRDQLTGGQSPDVALFGCSDSRIAAEIIFDRGLGDLFVIRNIGHIVAESIVASLEFAVVELGCALIVVLGHDSCGAVNSAIKLSVQDPPKMPDAVMRTLQPVLPAVQQVWLKQHSATPYVSPNEIDAEDVGKKHLQLTVNAVLGASNILRDAVAAGKLGIVGCHYSLSAGLVHPICAVGAVDTSAPEI